MELHHITIGQLGHARGACFRDRLFITDRVDDVERFRSPCRVNAVTMLVCTGGEAECSVNLRRYRICGDTVLLSFPDDIIQIHRTQGLEAYAVLLSLGFVNELGIDFRRRSDFYLEVRRDAACRLPHDEILALRPYYTLMEGNVGRLRPESPEIIRGLAQAFAYTVISLVRLFREPEPEREGGGGAERNRLLFMRFMDLVRLHHTHARGVRFYADKMCLTPNYLSGAVKEYSGKTATEWVNEYVVQEAEIMLKDPGLSVQEIAYRLNFPTQSAFGKYFKQQVGVGPRQYREQGGRK